MFQRKLHFFVCFSKKKKKFIISTLNTRYVNIFCAMLPISTGNIFESVCKKKKKIPVLMCIKKFPVKVRNATVVLFPHRLLI